MTLLVLLPVIAIAAVVALAMDVPGGRVARWAGMAVAVVVGLGVLEAIAVIGLRGTDGDGGAGDRRRDDVEAADADDAAVGTAATTSTTISSPSPADVRTVDAVMFEPDPEAAFPRPPRPVDDLDDGDLLFVEAPLEGDGEIRQCPEGAVRPTACGTALPVPAPRDEVAQFLVAVVDDLVTDDGTIDCSDESCMLVLFVAEEGDVVATLPLVFGQRATEPAIEVLDDGPFEGGDAAEVRLRDFPPGEAVVVTQCTPPGPSNRLRCGTPAPEVDAVVGPDGEAVVQFPVHLGSVGADGRDCQRAEPCAIAVVDASVTAAAVPISLAGSPRSEVPGDRVAWALVVAGIFAAVAITLVVRGDWDDPDGDPFAGVRLTIPEGWEELGRPEASRSEPGVTSGPLAPEATAHSEYHRD